MELGESGLVAVGEYPSLPQAQEHALVVLAMNLSCWLGRAPTEGYLLLSEDGSVAEW